MSHSENDSNICLSAQCQWEKLPKHYKTSGKVLGGASSQDTKPQQRDRKIICNFKIKVFVHAAATPYHQSRSLSKTIKKMNIEIQHI